MCGITGAVGLNANDVLNAIFYGLNALQNRGNDSFGFSYFNESGLSLEKRSNPNKEYFETLMRDSIIKDKTIKHNIALGHCRWATHGANTDANAHPHLDSTGLFAIVHNGTIDNCSILKEELQTEGYVFLSETDTEVIVNLVSFYFNTDKSQKDDPTSPTVKQGQEQAIEARIINAINLTVKRLNGIWACALITEHQPDSIFVFSKTCPLLLGWAQDLIAIASEQSAFNDQIKHYGRLKDNQVIVIKHKQSQVQPSWFKYITERKSSISSKSPDPYAHWMIKEIHDQPASTALIIQKHLFNQITIPSLNSHLEALLTCDHIILIGCGTSYYAGNYCRHFLTELDLYKTVQCIDASEFDLSYLPKRSKVICFLLSQSGETMDLIKVQLLLKKQAILNIAIVNVEGSTISMGADATVLINAGREIAVASTKSYTNQVVTLRLIALWLSIKQGDTACPPTPPRQGDFNQKGQEQEFIGSNHTESARQLKMLPNQITQTLEDCDALIRQWAATLATCQRVFILGKKIGYSIAKEASLKLKEVGYIHSEAYSASALKHGPYSLIEIGRPIIFIIAQEDQNENANIINTITEVRSRGATIYIVTDCDQTQVFGRESSIIKVPYNRELYGILQILPFQLLAYYLALEKGHNPDFPRNLAKCVTVD